MPQRPILKGKDEIEIWTFFWIFSVIVVPCCFGQQYAIDNIFVDILISVTNCSTLVTEEFTMTAFEPLTTLTRLIRLSGSEQDFPSSVHFLSLTSPTVNISFLELKSNETFWSVLWTFVPVSGTITFALTYQSDTISKQNRRNVFASHVMKNSPESFDPRPDSIHNITLHLVFPTTTISNDAIFTPSYSEMFVNETDNTTNVYYHYEQLDIDEDLFIKVIFDGHIEQCPTKYTKETIIAAIVTFGLIGLLILILIIAFLKIQFDWNKRALKRLFCKSRKRFKEPTHKTEQSDEITHASENKVSIHKTTDQHHSQTTVDAVLDTTHNLQVISSGPQFNTVHSLNVTSSSVVTEPHLHLSTTLEKNETVRRESLVSRSSVYGSSHYYESEDSTKVKSRRPETIFEETEESDIERVSASQEQRKFVAESSGTERET